MTPAEPIAPVETLSAPRGRATAPPPPARHTVWQLPLLLIGWGLLLAWAWWWLACFRAPDPVEQWRSTRIPGWEYLGLDFLHNFDAVRIWITNGGNPYRQDFGDWLQPYGYPPTVLALFAWTALVSRGAAVRLWMACIAGVVVLAGWRVAWWRKEIGVSRLPLPFIWGVTLCSMPVLFAMERGQCDAIILVLILAAAEALRRPPSWGRDLFLGGCAALATWVKIYPGVLILGLLALRAWRASGLAVLEAALVGLVPFRATQDWIAASAVSQQDRVGLMSEILDWLRNPQHKPVELTGWYPTIGLDSHSLAMYWATFWRYTHIGWLENLPGVLGAGLILFLLALWVSARLFKSPARTQLALPYLLWLAALGSFWMPLSYDYNLLYLPLAALVVCDRRDPLLLGLTLLAMVPWWQPLRLGDVIGPEALMLLKLLSLLAVGSNIVRRAREGVLPAPADSAGFAPAAGTARLTPP